MNLSTWNDALSRVVADEDELLFIEVTLEVSVELDGGCVFDT